MMPSLLWCIFYFHSIWNYTIVLTLCSAIWWWSNFIWEKWLRMICNYGSLHANMWPLMAADGVCQVLFPANVDHGGVLSRSAVWGGVVGWIPIVQCCQGVLMTLGHGNIVLCSPRPHCCHTNYQDSNLSEQSCCNNDDNEC